MADMLTGLFQFHMNPIELVVRGTLMYWFLYLVFRFLTRRDIGAVGMADILLLVLVADASQNAMAGEYHTVAEGCVLVGTLIGWNLLIDWASFRWEAVARLVEPRPLLLIRHGRVLHRNLRREFVTLDELKAQLRQYGIANIEDVRTAFLESDGKFSVVPKRSRHEPVSTAPPRDDGVD